LCIDLEIPYIKDYIICALIIQKQYINNLIEDARTILYLINFQNFIDRVGLTMI